MDTSNLGRLHIVLRGRNTFTCRECLCVIEPKMFHYRQNVYSSHGFGRSTRVCYNCGEFLRVSGCIIIDDKIQRMIKKESHRSSSVQNTQDQTAVDLGDTASHPVGDPVAKEEVHGSN